MPSGKYRKKSDTRQCLEKSDCLVKKLVNRSVWEDLLFPACRTNAPITTPLISGRGATRAFIFDVGERAHSDRLWVALMRHWHVNIFSRLSARW